jgi:type IV secretion system protein VirB9
MSGASHILLLAVLGAVALSSDAAEPADRTGPSAPDPRVLDVLYDGSVITINVRRGVATEIDLEPTESIAFAATGYGSDCEAKETDASWCIAAIPGQHVVFVKPRSSAVGANNLQVVTNSGRSYSFVLALLGESGPRQAVYRLAVHLPKPAPPADRGPVTAVLPPAAAPTAEELLSDRLAAVPKVVNSAYSLAVGKDSQDIVPDLVFDDGRFTYFRFPGNREIPGVFQRASDGVESTVNTEMEGDLLRVDRVQRQFYLRMGRQAVRVWNDAFDINGRPPVGGVTVDGVERVTRKDAGRKPGDPR